jgi:hypothetical protein
MATARAWRARDPVEAFFPVELRALFMPIGKAMKGFSEAR